MKYDTEKDAKGKILYLNNGHKVWSKSMQLASYPKLARARVIKNTFCWNEAERRVQGLRGTFLSNITLDADVGNAFHLKSLRCFGK